MERYDAFISYSQRVERPLVVALQREMEDLGRPRYRRRTLRVFRDNANLGASAGLWSSVERALAASDWFILIASEEAARSEWVRKEVAWWLEHRTTDRMLIALLDGQIVWTGGDFDFPATTALPPMLAGRFAEEPLYIDLRPVRARSRETARELIGPETVADLMAPIRGVPKDSIVGQHLTLQRRSRRIIRSVVAGLTALTVASAAATFVAVNQQRTAERERTRAEAQAREATSRRLADLSLRSPGRDESLQYLFAAQAYRFAPTTAATGALFQLAQTVSDWRGSLAKDKLARVVGHRNGVAAASFSPSGSRVATVDGAGAVRITETASPKVSTVTVDGARDVAFLDDAHAIVASTTGLHRIDVATASVVPGEYGHRGAVAALAALGEGAVLCLGVDGTVLLVGPEGVRKTLPAPVGAGRALHLALAAKVAVVQGEGGVAVVDTGSLAVRSTWNPVGRQVTSISPDGARAILLALPDTLEDGVADVVDAATGRSLWHAETVGWFVPKGAAFLPGGTSIVVATSGGVDGIGGQVFTRSEQSPKEDIQRPPPAPETISGIWPSHDGARLVIASDTGAAEVVAVGQQQIDPVYPLSATSTGTRLLVRTTGGLGVADLDTGTTKEITTGAGGVLTPDGRSIVTVDGRIVDTDTGQVRHTVTFLVPTTLAQVGESYFSQAAGPWFPSPDRRTFIASACKVRLADVATFQTVAEAPGPPEIQGGCDGTYDAAWTASGRTLLIGQESEQLNRYLVHGSDLLQQACRLAGRNLTPAEWGLYLPDWPYERTCPTNAATDAGTGAPPAPSADAGGSMTPTGTGNSFRDLATPLNPDLPQCRDGEPVPRDGCLRVFRQDDRQAVLGLALGNDYTDYYLLEKQNGRWTVKESHEVNVSGNGPSPPSWLPA